jgi:polysaccharide biosynthesis protein PelA
LKTRPTSLPLLLSLLFLAGAAAAVDAEAQPFERKVLGVYSAAGGNSGIDNPLRYNVEMVLHHLGLHLDYCEYERGLPAAADMAQYRGVVLWLSSSTLPRAAEYWDWLALQLRAGRRVVLLNGTGPRHDADTGQTVPLSRVNKALTLMGLRGGSNYSGMPLDIALVSKVPAMVEFERNLDFELSSFDELASISSANRVFLELRMKSTGARAAAVVLTPRGGVAASGYFLHMDPESFKKQWRLDPFAFLEQALGVEGAPRPDATTLNGNRIYSSHIDGDGILNRSLMNPLAPCGAVIRDQILKRYWMLPFTPSVIVAEIDPEALGSPEAQELARSIFALPNVEVASHTYSHPLVWNIDLVSAWLLSEYAAEAPDIQNSGQAILPWVIDGYEYDPEVETAGSCRYVSAHLSPPGKRCRVLLWSGNTLPDEPAMAACARSGVLNMNGGDSRMDGEFPSYTGVAPLYRQVGPYIQVHSANSNENTYTGLWTGPYGGYQNVLQTFARTEAPRRILPINIYYHHYSGERHASLRSLQRVYEWVLERRKDLFPVYASRYIAVVRGVHSTRLEQLSDKVWRVTRNGACRTVRFDRCSLYVDWERSSGLLGFRHLQGSLYVSLDEGDDHIIALSEEAPDAGYLLRASADVLDLTPEADGGFSFRSAALDSALYIWANTQPDAQYTVTVSVDSGIDDDTAPHRSRARSNPDGILRLDLPLRGSRRIRVTPRVDRSRL